MIIGSRLRRRIAQILGPVIAASLVAYFLYYTVDGDRGLRALTRMQAQAAGEEATLADLKAQREALEAKVMSLRPDSIDPDRLDECTRALLNDTRPDELVIELPGAADHKACAE
jgi:cell division protein FtsB